ncbi:MAG: hypothetical protein KIT31_20030 [Deltaproteobacteria bacterium]|nr:hypothetical protein [Deltaproteobacteria bacterium]
MNMQILLSAVGLACVATVATVAHADDAQKYSLADLKALVEQKSYLEAVQHLGDIAPAQRTGEWIELAGAASAGAVAGAEADAKLGYMIEIEKMYPNVLKSPKYVAVRTDAAKPAFDGCFRRRHAFQDCHDAALKFVDADVKNAKLTLDVAKAVRLGMSHYSAVPFFKRAHAAGGKAVCKDEDLKLAVISGLGLPDKDTRLEEAIGLTYACFDDMKAPILKELTADSGYFHDRACDLLASRRVPLPADKERLCAAPRKK